MIKKASNIVRRAIEILCEEGVRIFSNKALSYLSLKLKLNPCILPYTLLKIKSLNENEKNLNDLVNFCSYNLGGLIAYSQVQDEILELLRILDEIKPKVIIEIGTAGGGTLFLFPHVASEDATIISIDLPGGKFGGGYPKWKIPLYNAFRLPKQKLHLIRANSHSQETLKKVKNVLNGRKVDFLFIDGDHTYEGVKKDFEMYSTLIKGNGIIAFHDIVFGPKENVGGVPGFWEEVKDNYYYSFKEIVKDWGQEGYGIGILYVSEKNENYNNNRC